MSCLDLLQDSSHNFVVLRQAVQKRIAAMPRQWIPAAQTFRLGVEWVLHLEHVRGRAPVQVLMMPL